MTVAAVLVFWCSGSLLMAPLVGRAIRSARDEDPVVDPAG